MLMNSKNVADTGGIACAGLCIAHCLFTPVLLIIFVENSWLEELEYLFMGFSTLAAILTTANNRRSIYLLGIWAGVLLLCISILLEEHFSFASKLVYISSTLLIVFHFLNLRLQTKCTQTGN